MGRELGEAIVHANGAANEDFSMLLLYKNSGLRPDFPKKFRPSAEWSELTQTPPLKSGTVINKGGYFL